MPATTIRWCILCCTDHPPEGRCPGELQASGPEEAGWRITVETPRGPQGYGVLLAPLGRRWRARILTFPNVLWTIPGGGGSIKFIGRSREEAELRAQGFIREHCARRSYVMRDELELVDDMIAGVDAPNVSRVFTELQRTPRFRRNLPVRFGRNRPTLCGKTSDMSSGGLFVATDHPMQEGLVGLELELEHCRVPLRGSVVWHRIVPESGRPPGMGLRLLNPPPVYLNYIDALD